MIEMLRRLERWLVFAESTLAGLSLLTILGLSLAEIVGRNVLHQGVPGADTAMRHLVLWVAFFGAVLAVADNRHVKIDVATAWLPKGLLAWLARPFDVFSALVCGLLGMAGLSFWREEWTTSPPDERWVAILIIILPVGFALISLHFLLRALIGPRSAEHQS